MEKYSFVFSLSSCFFSSLENFFVIGNLCLLILKLPFLTLHFFHQKNIFQHFLLECLLCLFVSSFRSSSVRLFSSVCLFLFSRFFFNLFFVLSTFSFFLYFYRLFVFYGLLSSQHFLYPCKRLQNSRFLFSFSPTKIGFVCFFFCWTLFTFIFHTFCPFFCLEKWFLV